MGDEKDDKKTDPVATAISAFDAGIENPEPVQPAISDEEASGDGKGGEGEGAGGDEGEKSGTGSEAGEAGDAAAGKEGKPKPGEGGESGEGEGDEVELTEEQKAAAEAAKADEAFKKAAVDEANALGLRGKANERFVALTEMGRKQADTIKAQSTELTSYREAFGVPADAKPEDAKRHMDWMAKAAADQIKWDAALQDIGGTPEQFGDAMGIIKAFNSNDPKLLAAARTNMLAWVGQIDAALGEETDRYNPLSEFPDLLEKVESGKMDKADALETAKLRRQNAARAAQERTTQESSAATKAETQGLADLSALGRTLKAADGDAVFTGKMAMIRGRLEADIKNYQIPPEKWASYAKQLYDGAVFKPKERVLPGKQPIRQQNTTVSSTPVPTPKNAVDAFDIGVAEAKARGN